MLPEQQRLSVCKGSWTVERSEESYLEVCNWIQGNYIQCISVSREKTKVDSPTSYLSYSPLEKIYLYYGLYPSGNSRTLRGTGEDERFIFTGQRMTTERTTKWRITVTPMGKDLHFVEESSVNDNTWEKKKRTLPTKGCNNPPARITIRSINHSRAN